MSGMNLRWLAAAAGGPKLKQAKYGREPALALLRCSESQVLTGITSRS
jgi:hypothetical protein